MKKNITVILKTKNKSQSSHENIKKVSRGYAFNYLIPKKLAEIATPGRIKHLSMLRDAASQNQSLIREQNIKIKQKLGKIKIIHTRRKSGSRNSIFGSISEQDIKSEIYRLTGQKLDKKQIRIEGNKQVGKQKIIIGIEENLDTSLSLHILPNKA